MKLFTSTRPKNRRHNNLNIALRTAESLTCAVCETLERRALLSGLATNISPRTVFAHTTWNADVDLHPLVYGPTPCGVAGGEPTDQITASNGSQLLAGFTSGGDIFVERRNSDWSLDATFGSGGDVITDLGSSSDQAHNVAITSDQKIIVTALTDAAAADGTGWEVALARYNIDGTLDSTFGVDGILSTGLGRNPTYGAVTVILNDGTIHVTGNSQGVSKAMEYDPNGHNGFDRLTNLIGVARPAELKFRLPSFLHGYLVPLIRNAVFQGPLPVASNPLTPTADDTINEGDTYTLNLRGGDGYTVDWKNGGGVQTVFGHPTSATSPQIYPDNSADEAITATSENLYARDLEVGSLAYKPPVGGGGATSAIYAKSIGFDTDGSGIPTGAIDLQNNDLVVEYGENPSPFFDVRDWMKAGYRPAPDSSATGIVSTTSQNNGGQTYLLLFDNALIGTATWPPASTHPVDANSVIGRYTYFGDASADGRVTGDDYAIVDGNLGTVPDARIALLSGDTNVDDMVSGDDYAIIDANLGLGVGNPLAATAVYEPAVQITKHVQVNNVAPASAIIGAPATATPGTQLNMTAGGYDPSPVDAARLSYSWRASKSGTVLQTGSGSTFNFIPNSTGNYVIGLTTRDKDNGSSTASRTIVANATVQPWIDLDVFADVNSDFEHDNSDESEQVEATQQTDLPVLGDEDNLVELEIVFENAAPGDFVWFEYDQNQLQLYLDLAALNPWNSGFGAFLGDLGLSGSGTLPIFAAATTSAPSSGGVTAHLESSSSVQSSALSGGTRRRTLFRWPKDDPEWHNDTPDKYGGLDDGDGSQLLTNRDDFWMPGHEGYGKHTLIIGFAGHTQSLGFNGIQGQIWDIDPKTGTYQIGQLIVDSPTYDFAAVTLFPEDPGNFSFVRLADCGDGVLGTKNPFSGNARVNARGKERTGALNFVIDAIKHHGVNHIGLFGYSHGAASARLLIQSLAHEASYDSDLLNRFIFGDINFWWSSYIDAIHINFTDSGNGQYESSGSFFA